MSRLEECLSFELLSEYVSVKKKSTHNAPLSPGVTEKLKIPISERLHTRKEHNPSLVYQTIKFR